MGTDHLAKYGKPRKPPILGECFEVSDVPAEYVEFRDVEDNVVHVQYSTLTVVDFNPSKNLTLRFGKFKVIVKGGNLRELVPLFSEQRITLCKTEDSRGETHDDRLPFVTRVKFPKSIHPDEEGDTESTAKPHRRGVADHGHLPGLSE